MLPASYRPAVAAISGVDGRPANSGAAPLLLPPADDAGFEMPGAELRGFAASRVSLPATGFRFRRFAIFGLLDESGRRRFSVGRRQRRRRDFTAPRALPRIRLEAARSQVCQASRDFWSRYVSAWPRKPSMIYSLLPLAFDAVADTPPGPPRRGSARIFQGLRCSLATAAIMAGQTPLEKHSHSLHSATATLSFLAQPEYAHFQRYRRRRSAFMT